eukprot:COSAG05_NODE_2267_length_3306_cov_49.931400_4_plen_39_part_01
MLPNRAEKLGGRVERVLGGLFSHHDPDQSEEARQPVQEP